jgi:hypothetical protein
VGREEISAAPALGADLLAGRTDFLEGFLSLVIPSVYGNGPGRWGRVGKVGRRRRPRQSPRAGVSTPPRYASTLSRTGMK